MRTTKRISSLAFAIVAFAITLATVSCQSKQDKKSEQSNDSAFVFTTPKVIDMGTYLEKQRNKTIKPDTTCFITLSEIADDVEYVLLKASNGKQEVFIDFAENIFICKDYIFVQMNANIVQYDRQGNLIRTIGQKGGGPGEYVWVDNMVVDDESKRIIITTTSGKINEYNYEGKFIRDIKTPYSGKLMPLDGGRIALDVSNIRYDIKERLVILNKKGEVEKSFPRYQLFEHTDYERVDCYEDRIPRLTKFHDVVCFNEAFNDTIFELKNNELHMRYFVDWGKYALKPEYIIYENQEYAEKMQKCYWLGGFYETDRYIIMPKFRSPYIFVYDKKEDKIKQRAPYITKDYERFKKIFKSAKGGFFNTIDGGLDQEINGISLDSKYIYCWYFASDVKDYYEEAEYGEYALLPDKQAKLKALVSTIDENKHNLLIMMSKLKE